MVEKDGVVEGRMGLLGSVQNRFGLLKFEIMVDGLTTSNPKFTPKSLVLEVSDSEQDALIPIV